ncbi:hypothetical protein SDC9_141441 [bioreactor metagenome]|uniref:Uncharacterized protein n=1 Tax=bioreactor metagenome TaxID=1076179 RepID=A0A645DYA4_9ZZZZ
MLKSVFANVGAAQAGRLDEIDLNGRKLPVAAEYITGDEIGFGTVESGLTGGFKVLQAAGIHGRAQGVFGLGPLFIILHILAFFAAQAEAHAVIGEVVGIQHLADEAEGAFELALDLILGAEGVAIILRQAAHAGKPVELSRLLIAVQGGEFCKAQRQLTVGVQAHLFVEGHVAGAVHGFEAEGDVLIHHGREHDVLVVIVMAGAFVEVLFDHMPGEDVGVAVLGLQLAHVLFHLIAQLFALGGKEGQTGADIIREVEETQFLAKLAMIALLGFFQAPQVVFELVRR